MSTKAIRDVLEQIRSSDGQRSDNDRVEWAIRELDAIEKAARALDEWESEHPSKRSVEMCRNAGDAFGLMATIAKQEP